MKLLFAEDEFLGRMVKNFLRNSWSPDANKQIISIESEVGHGKN